MPVKPNSFDFAIENADAFQKALDRLGKVTSDFRIPFTLIASDFYRSQRKLFTLSSEGLYNPLGGFNFNSPSGFGTQTKRQRAEDLKERRVKRSWNPILYGETGQLRDSTLSPTHRYAVFFKGRQQLLMGTKDPKAKFHQSDKPRTVMPLRKIIFIDGGPADRSSDASISGRRERWLNIIEDHITQLVSGEVL